MVVLSSNVLPQIRLTVDEYLQADLPEGQRYELVEGVVEMPPTPDIAHHMPISPLQDQLYAYRRSHPDAFEHLSQRATVPIPGRETVREPDVAVYRKMPHPRSGWRVWREAVPVLVVEVVSPGQEARDYWDKRQDYWLAGIPEYWIVDPQQRQVTILIRGQDDWVESVVKPGQQAESTVLAGFSIPVAGLFP